MPLKPCPDCGRQVSTSAATCPGCGRDLAPDHTGWYCLAGLLAAALGTGGALLMLHWTDNLILGVLGLVVPAGLVYWLTVRWG